MSSDNAPILNPTRTHVHDTQQTHTYLIEMNNSLLLDPCRAIMQLRNTTMSSDIEFNTSLKCPNRYGASRLERNRYRDSTECRSVNQQRARLVVKTLSKPIFLEDSRGGRRALARQSSWPNAHGQILIVMILVYYQKTHPRISHATGLKPGGFISFLGNP